VVSRGLLPRTGGIRRRARPPAYRHHAAPAWQVGASTLLPAYLLGRNPDLRIAIASYSASLASKFNRRVQRIIDSPEYAAFFPETTIKRGARPPEYLRTADEVEIIGHRGGLLSVGREGALTGNRVDCFILDDLYRK
jgi:hypothetical protein